LPQQLLYFVFIQGIAPKREFRLFPTPETVVSLVFKVVKLVVLAGILYLGGLWAWHRAFPPSEPQRAVAAPSPVHYPPGRPIRRKYLIPPNVGTHLRR
jgi:hypothetical protein